MNSIGIVGLIAVVAYSALLICLSIFSARKDASTVATGKKFFLGKGLGIFVLLFSMMASSFSTWVIMGAPVTTFNSGWQWIALVTLYQISLSFICGYLGPRFWVLRHKFDFVSHADLTTYYFKDNKIRYIQATGFILGLCCSTIAQFKAMGTSISAMTGGALPVWLCSLFLYFIIAIYVCVGGFHGTSLIDTAQGLLFTVILWGGLILVLIKCGGLGAMFDGVAAVENGKYILFSTWGGSDNLWNPVTAISFCTVATVGGFFSAGFWQRYYAAKDTKTLVKMSVWFPILVSIGVSTTGGLVGLAAHHFINQGVEVGEISSVFQNLLSALSTPWWAVIVVIGVLAAGLSTVAGNMNGASMIATYDFIHTRKPDVNDVKLKNYGRVFLLVLMFIVWACSVKTPSAVTALVQLSTAFFAMALYPISTIFFWKRGTKAGTLAGMLGSLITVILTTFVFVKPLGIEAGMWGMIVGLTLYIVISLCTKPVPQAQRDEFMAPLRATKTMDKTATD